MVGVQRQDKLSVSRVAFSRHRSDHFVMVPADDLAGNGRQFMQGQLRYWLDHEGCIAKRQPFLSGNVRVREEDTYPCHLYR